MKKFIPTKLIVSAFTLREEGNSGKCTKEKDIVKDKPIANEVETDITKYEVGEGSKKEVLVLTESPISKLVALTSISAERLQEIIGVTTKGSLKQFRSILNAIDSATNLTNNKNKLKADVAILQSHHEKQQLKINEND